MTETLAARGSTYGNFADNAFAAQQLKEVMRQACNWNKLSLTQREGLDLIMLKVSRIVTGDPDHKDNWHDIAGYATIVEDRII